jgi:hypothetical protein
MAPSANRRRTILALALAGSLAAAVALPALAATSTKVYTPSITPTSSAAGATVSPYTFKIQNNLSSNQQMGSANITVQSGFTVSNLRNVQTSAGKTWTAVLNTTTTPPTIILRNPGPGPANRLNPGEYVTVQFDARAPCVAPTSSWITRVKQSNDFSGTGNDFTRSGPDPVVAVTGVCTVTSISFTVQPSDTKVDATISPAVEVTVANQYNNPFPNVAVTMSLGTNPGGAGTLAGTLSQTTNGSGVATFDDLSINHSSSGYTLVAAAGSLTKTSDPFDITSASVGCDVAISEDCHTSATSGTSTVSVNADGGTGTLSVTFESVPLDCGSNFGGVGATITIDPPQGSPPPPSITVTFDDTISPTLQDSYPVCKTVESESGTTTEIVPFCSDNPVPALPCVDEQSIRFHGSQPPTLHTVLLITQTDPRTLH